MTSESDTYAPDSEDEARKHDGERSAFPLQREIETYEAHKAELLERGAGKFALIFEDTVFSDVFDCEQDAIACGYRHFGNVPFLVKQVHDGPEPVISMPAFLPVGGEPAPPQYEPSWRGKAVASLMRLDLADKVEAKGLRDLCVALRAGLTPEQQRTVAQDLLGEPHVRMLVSAKNMRDADVTAEILVPEKVARRLANRAPMVLPDPADPWWHQAAGSREPAPMCEECVEAERSPHRVGQCPRL